MNCLGQKCTVSNDIAYSFIVLDENEYLDGSFLITDGKGDVSRFHGIKSRNMAFRQREQLRSYCAFEFHPSTSRCTGGQSSRSFGRRVGVPGSITYLVVLGKSTSHGFCSDFCYAPILPSLGCCFQQSS